MKIDIYNNLLDTAPSPAMSHPRFRESLGTLYVGGEYANESEGRIWPTEDPKRGKFE